MAAIVRQAKTFNNGLELGCFRDQLGDDLQLPLQLFLLRESAYNAQPLRVLIFHSLERHEHGRMYSTSTGPSHRERSG